MKDFEILNRLNYSLFFIHLSSKNNHARHTEAFSQLIKLYPFKFAVNDIYLLKNKNPGEFLGFINLKLFPGKKVLCIEKYLLNHYRKFNGKIVVKTSDFMEFVEFLDGSMVTAKIIKDDKYKITNEVLIDEKDIFDTVRKKDLIIKKTRKQILIKLVVIFIFLLIFGSALGFGINSKINEYKVIQIEKEEKELKKKENIEREKELTDKLENLKNDYIQVYTQKYFNIYDFISIIYECIGNMSNIKNLNIEKNEFVVELFTQDSMKILANFENNKNIKNAQMTKTAVWETNEIVTYIGQFKLPIVFPKTRLSIEDQIKFYENKINEEGYRVKKMKQYSLSEYAYFIRQNLHSNNCFERYFQYRINKGVAILECFLSANNNNILSFIKNIQSNENIIDIYSINLINSNTNNLLDVTIKFYTGISVSDEFDNFSDEDLEISKVKPSELSVVFKSSQNRHVQKSQNIIPKQLNKLPIKKEILKTKDFEYIGLVKKGNKSFVVLKNKTQKSLLQIEVVDNILNYEKSCCQMEDNKIIVKIDNDIYEVII